LPWLSESHELNVRTYVSHGDRAGIWFFSLDAAHILAVWGARLVYHLPYFHARMSLTTEGTTRGQGEGETVRFSSVRIHPNAPHAEFSASWTTGERLPYSQPGSL